MKRSPFENSGTWNDIAFDCDLDRGPILHARNDLVAAGVDNDRIFGACSVHAGAPRKSHVGFESQGAIGAEQHFARGIADQASLVVERPLVRMAEFLVDPFGSTEHLGDDFAGP